MAGARRARLRHGAKLRLRGRLRDRERDRLRGRLRERERESVRERERERVRERVRARARARARVRVRVGLRVACRCSSCTAASMALRGGIRAPSLPRSGSHHVVRLPNLNASPFALSPTTAAASRCTASKSAAGSTSTYAWRRARRVGLPHVGLVCHTAEPAATGRPAAAPFESASTSHPNPNPARIASARACTSWSASPAAAHDSLWSWRFAAPIAGRSEQHSSAHAVRRMRAAHERDDADQAGGSGRGARGGELQRTRRAAPAFHPKLLAALPADDMYRSLLGRKILERKGFERF